MCHRPPEGLRSLPIMSAHVNIDITNVSSCIYITIPYFTSVGQTTLESIGWCLACELDVTSGAILINPGNKISQTPSMNQFYHLSQGKKKSNYLTCPKLVDIFSDTPPPQLVEQLLNGSGSLSTGRGGKAATAESHHNVRIVPVFGLVDDP